MFYLVLIKVHYLKPATDTLNMAAGSPPQGQIGITKSAREQKGI